MNGATLSIVSALGLAVSKRLLLGSRNTSPLGSITVSAEMTLPGGIFREDEAEDNYKRDYRGWDDGQADDELEGLWVEYDFWNTVFYSYIVDSDKFWMSQGFFNANGEEELVDIAMNSWVFDHLDYQDNEEAMGYFDVVSLYTNGHIGDYGYDEYYMDPLLISLRDNIGYHIRSRNLTEPKELFPISIFNSVETQFFELKDYALPIAPKEWIGTGQIRLFGPTCKVRLKFTVDIEKMIAKKCFTDKKIIDNLIDTLELSARTMGYPISNISRRIGVSAQSTFISNAKFTVDKSGLTKSGENLLRMFAGKKRNNIRTF
jgi:hypothetical protein